MKLFRPISLVLLAGTAICRPLSQRRQAALDDITILQFALTLEHLENVFYKAALSLFSLDDFKKAGFSKRDVENIEFIAEDEQTHVQLLTAAIQAANATPVAACNYVFPFTDVQSFMTLTTVLEGVGTSAYLGAAGLLSDKTTLTVAASIMVNEAIHTSQQRGLVKLTPAANALGTPLGANAVFSIAASFIESCPSTNVALPFQAFPSLTMGMPNCPGLNNNQTSVSSQALTSPNQTSVMQSTNATLSQPSKRTNRPQKNMEMKQSGCYMTAGQQATLIAAAQVPAGAFVTIVSGLTVISVEATVTDTIVVIDLPSSVSGQTFIFITSSAVTAIVDEVILFGPAIVEVAPAPPAIDITIL